MKILVELRPALDGHAGIPQETRLLFRMLVQLHGDQVEGLIQSSSKLLAPGLKLDASGRAAETSNDRRLNRLSRVVVSLRPKAKLRIPERLLVAARSLLKPAWMVLASLVGCRTSLGLFEADHFRDFVWRSLFARTLPSQDFDAVTSCRFRIAAVPWAGMHLGALLTRRLGYAVYPRLDTRSFDLMVAETPYPGRVTASTKLVVRYHDAIPILMPHTISDSSFHQASHFHALRRNVRDGAWFACVSDATRRDLIAVFPEVESRSVTIHNMISQEYFREASNPGRVPEIIRTRFNRSVLKGAPVLPRVEGGFGLGYLLMVSTIEPRKNHLSLLAAWEQLRSEGFADLKLILVGSLGWEHRAIVKTLRPWVERGDVHVLENVPSAELRLLYAHARATVCPSFGEGFDFSGIEAMSCGSVVAASDIPVHREVFGDAADYFNPYSVDSLAKSLQRLIAHDAAETRRYLLERGDAVSSQYAPDRIMPKWRLFLDQLMSDGSSAHKAVAGI
jgi:glycosyltransferase involved in cell wall biosynthesis